MKKETIILEIRAAEGGTDSKLLVEDLSNIYLKTARNNDFVYEITEQRPGICVIWLTGKGVRKYFQNESGNHRWIRVPPTEKRGRTQTSIISVALINPDNEFIYTIDRSEVKRQYTCSGGKGGQHVNRRSTAVQLTHIQTGIQVKCQDTRTQIENEIIAWKRLEDKLKEIEKNKHDLGIYSNRFDQIGYSDRSDKKRTYRIKDDIVIDHESNKTCSYKDFSKGKIELIS